MIYLVLDDDPVRLGRFRGWLRGHKVAFALDADAAIDALQAHGPFDVAFLDHDLGPGATGRTVAEHIAAMPRARRPARVVIHSWNPRGAADMHAILQRAGVDSAIAPFRDDGRFG
jgi:CheY-like chemotaxis protein